MSLNLKSTSRNYVYPVQLAGILSTLFVLIKVLFILVGHMYRGIQSTFLRVSGNRYTGFSLCNFCSKLSSLR
jgi:hypothetical protein